VAKLGHKSWEDCIHGLSQLLLSLALLDCLGH
jgi:hypothetical protein